MNLYINTKDRKQVVVRLKNVHQTVSELSEDNEYGSQALLPLIVKLLKKSGLKWQDIKGIEVEVGPGSFTGLRVGATVAETLGFTLDVPVNGDKNYSLELRYE